MTFHIRAFLIFIFAGFVCMYAAVSSALEPDEVLVVYNSKYVGAEKLAKYYMEKRHIPQSHLLKTSLTIKEVMSREEYEEDLVRPLLQKIKKLEEAHIYAVVLIYGVPLKVKQPLLDWDTLEQVQELKFEKEKLQGEGIETDALKDAVKELDRKIKALEGGNKRASVDSELALVKVEEYELDWWINNPYFIGFQKNKMEGLLSTDDVLIVARLDGPDLETVYRVIDDSLATEKVGLKGKAYFDARWQPPHDKNKKLSGYRLYDFSIHKAAEVAGKRMDVILDQKSALFPVNSAPGAALYCGWYSLAKYIDSFQWVKGAVGYHIASAECRTLKKAESTIWCVEMLKRGVAATLGPVDEPYVNAFPLPEVFFSYLTEGYLSLGESYIVSLPFLSWQMVLVGDPLYKPFAPMGSGLTN